MPAATTPNSDLSAKLREAITKEFPEATWTAKKVYTRVHVGRATLGYVYLDQKTPAVEVLNGDGKYTRFACKTAADRKAAIAAMRKVEKKAAKH